VDQATRDEFQDIVDSSNYFRFMLNDQAIRDSAEQIKDRKNHKQLAIMYRKLARAHMQEDAQQARLKRLVPLLRFDRQTRAS